MAVVTGGNSGIGASIALELQGKGLREPLLFEGKINGGTISRSGDRWFISVSVETEYHPALCESVSVGVDLGIKNLATLSDGKTLSNPQPLKNKLRRLKKLQRQLSKRQIGSQNRIKTKKKNI